VTPEDLKYTEEHEWLASTEGATVRVGITAYAQDPLGEVESTKSVSEIFAPISGEVTAVNTALDESPELINTDPYGAGWIVEIAAADPKALDSLMDATAYHALTETD